MDLPEVMSWLEQHGSEKTRNTLAKHGMPKTAYGVKVGDLKILVKKIKKNQPLAEALYATGNSDAMYLAGLIADEKQVTAELLDRWAKEANWYMLSEFTVAWLAADSGLGRDRAIEWIRSSEEKVACSGWSAYSSHVALRPDEELDLEEIGGLLEEIAAGIHDAPNRVRHTMNAFVIAVGGSVPALTKKALAIADTIGKVKVDMGGTACKVPSARPYIEKIEARGSLGKKRKVARC